MPRQKPLSYEQIAAHLAREAKNPSEFVIDTHHQSPEYTSLKELSESLHEELSHEFNKIIHNPDL